MNADLILHVVDASVPEDEMDEMTAAVDDVLEEIGAGANPRLLVLNKIDQLDADGAAAGCRAPPRRRAGLGSRRVRASTSCAAASSRSSAPASRSSTCWFRTSAAPCCRELHDLAGDLEREDTAAGVRVKARVPAAVAERLRPYDRNGHEPA